MTDVDVLIVGGGVLGLLVLRRAIAAKYSALLFEEGQLGGGQTLHAQGYLIGGHVYARGGAGAGKLVYGGAFRQAVSAWKSELAALGGASLGTETFHLVDEDDLPDVATDWWRKHSRPVDERPPLLTQDGHLFHSGEDFLLDSVAVVDALANDHRQHMRSGTVTNISATTGVVTVRDAAWAAHRLEAGVVIETGLSDLVPETAARIMPEQKVVALVVRGADLPEFALTFTDRGRFRVGGSIVEEPFTVQAVPRRRAGSAETAALVCSSLLPSKFEAWESAMAVAVWSVLPALHPGAMEYGRYTQETWPKVGNNGFQVEAHARAIGARPVRFTFAPLAADEVMNRLDGTLAPTGRLSPQARAVCGGARPQTAPERWQNSSRLTFGELP